MGGSEQKMMEYFYFDIIVLIALLSINSILKTKVFQKSSCLFCSKRIYFWIVILTMFFTFEIIAINRWFIVYLDKISGIYLGFNVPIEELLFVIFWVLLTLIPWEYFKKNWR